LWKALNVAQDMLNAGETNGHRLETAMLRTIELAPSARLDYAEIVHAETFEHAREVKRGDVALIAAHIGKTRLIDNLIL
jgi:pantoate--beta-alanine ligase